MLIVIQPAQQQCRQANHGTQSTSGVVGQGGWVKRQVHFAVDQRVVLLINLGQTAVEILLEQVRHPLW
ncbi:hypothetical protein D3C72_2542640 [compost metagenome]